MKLTDLSAELVDITADGIRHGGSQALYFDCPCKSGHRLLIPFSPAIGGGGEAAGSKWARSGETLDSLTLSPSLAIRGGPDGRECWHGWVRAGEAVSC
jgi:hypothetical protein